MGSNPTLRTKNAPIYSTEDYDSFLRAKRTRKGYPLADSTVEHRVKAIRLLMKRFNLWDTEAVEEFIDKAGWTNGHKEHVSLAYRNWCESKGFEYEPRKYKRQVKLTYIPAENEIDQLIGGFSVYNFSKPLQYPLALGSTCLYHIFGERARTQQP